MDFKNVAKLLAFSLAVSGCITRESVVKNYEVDVKQNDGTTKKVKGSCGVNELQFTRLGNAYNGITYAVLGTGYGAYFRCVEGITSTNNLPIIGPMVNGAFGFFSGAAEGMCKGSIKGWKLKYGEGPTLDDLVANQVQERTEQMRNWVSRCIGE